MRPGWAETLTMSVSRLSHRRLADIDARIGAGRGQAGDRAGDDRLRPRGAQPAGAGPVLQRAGRPEYFIDRTASS
jgi:hypothetical protein